MIIPNDTGHPYRLNKFVEYQHLAPSIDPATLIEYARRNKLGVDDAIVLAWYHSVTYCELTAILLLETLPWRTMKLRDVVEYWEVHKPNLIFNSARRYAKNMDWFVPLMSKFMSEVRRQPSTWLMGIASKGGPNNDQRTRYNNIYNEVKKWKYMGRFSVDLFLEALMSLSEGGFIPLDMEIENWDWKDGSNMTSGLYNIFYMDEEADLYDKEGIVGDTDELTKMMFQVIDKINEVYPNQDVSVPAAVNKICSFRNLFKGNRYGGFHHDRQLGNIIEYQNSYPDLELIDEFYEIRESLFPPHMLGEKNDWTDIRKDRKKLWLREGLTGVEAFSKY